VIAAIPRGHRVDLWGGGEGRGPARPRPLDGLRIANFAPSMNLPWHRVVAAGGRIAFPASSPQFREQVRRLRSDGVPVKAGRVSSAVMADLDAF